MKAYFDSKDLDNLYTPSSTIVANSAMKMLFEDTGFELDYTKDYTKPGIYNISVLGFANHWSGVGADGFTRHILYEVPLDVIEAARARKVIIVINSQAEGFPLVRKGVDGFKEMHRAMSNLKLPQDSVVLIDSNKETGVLYDTWCAENQEKHLFKHVYFLSGFYYFYDRIPRQPLIVEAMSNPNSKAFNSLNRMVRQHRMDHLYDLITNNLHREGLVSGNYVNLKHKIMDVTVKPTYVNTDYNTYQSVFMKNCPLTIDGEWYNDNPDKSREHIFNHAIYANSLMSFVTETAFHDAGMFITEKVFKSIVAGHPFIVMGQPGYLDALEEMGYKVDFEGIDRKYDKIKSPFERFTAVQNELKKWIALGRGDKERFLTRSLPIIDYNFKLYQTKNYQIKSYERLNEEVTNIFKKYGQS